MSIKSADDKIKDIEKDRYLIPCTCTICNKKFDDIILGTHHISKDHSKRKKRNVIDNLSWNVKDDIKKWEILQELKLKRDMIISKLTDENAIKNAKIPDIVEIQRKKADISHIMEALLADLEKTEKTPEKAEEEAEEEEVEDTEEDIDERDFEGSEGEEEEAETEEEAAEEENQANAKSEKFGISKGVKKRNLCDLLERELEKYVDAIKRLTMSSEVEKIISSKKKSKISLNSYANQLGYYLGVAKAIKIIQDSKMDLEIII